MGAQTFGRTLDARHEHERRSGAMSRKIKQHPASPEARVGIEPSPFLKICRPQTAIVSFRLEEIVRARSVQSNAAVDDQLRAGNVARILRQQESCCPSHFVGCAEPFQERLGGKRFFKPFQLVSGNTHFL